MTDRAGWQMWQLFSPEMCDLHLQQRQQSAPDILKLLLLLLCNSAHPIRSAKTGRKHSGLYLLLRSTCSFFMTALEWSFAFFRFLNIQENKALTFY